jgi:hypothetical protein
MSRHAQYLTTSKPIPDRTAAKPNNEAPADDYQSQGIVVWPSEEEPDDHPTGDHDHSEHESAIILRAAASFFD